MAPLWRWLLVIVLIVVAVFAIFSRQISGIVNLLLPPVPRAQKVERAVWLDQNWSSSDRYWFHHVSQGTSTIPIPYRWFIALDAPELGLVSSPPLLASDAYLSRLGFIPSLKGGAGWQQAGYGQPVDPKAFEGWQDGALGNSNPAGLPVGFAITRAYRDPVSGKMLPDQIGLTCAACHTGHLEYKGISLRIDGANAAVSLPKLTDAIGAALFLTDKLPWRFARFAGRVLGPHAAQADKDKLQAELKATLANLQAMTKANAAVDGKSTPEGFNRIDALNRIGNQVFYSDLLGNKVGFDPSVNNVPRLAPVKFPHLWDTPWFIWAQYDGSIMQPIVRNAGEAVGVGARINMISYDNSGDLWKSSIDFKHLHDIEDALAGSNPLAPDAHGHPRGFNGLRAPKWPEAILGRIDRGLAVRGRQVYIDRCQGCHMPPVNDPAGQIYNPALWTTPTSEGLSYLKVNLIDQAYVGTDPEEELILSERKITTPAQLGIEGGKQVGDMYCFDQPSAPATSTSFGQALASAVQKAVAVYQVDKKKNIGHTLTVRDARPNCIQAKPVYKARPLDGIWAVPPYLHNGSVPSLEALLSSDPARDRPARFCLGNRAYDPGIMGLDTGGSCPRGGFTFDATARGNSNRGHEFRDGPRGKGVIGAAISPQDRRALMEYLKTI